MSRNSSQASNFLNFSNVENLDISEEKIKMDQSKSEYFIKVAFNESGED